MTDVRLLLKHSNTWNHLTLLKNDELLMKLFKLDTNTWKYSIVSKKELKLV